MVALNVSFPNFKSFHPVFKLVLKHVGRDLSGFGYFTQLFLFLVLQILNSCVELNGLVVYVLFVLDELGERHGSQNAVGTPVCHLTALRNVGVLNVYERDAAEISRGKAVFANVLGLHWSLKFSIRTGYHF